MLLCAGACGLPASRESVEEAIGYPIPPGASGFRLRDVNVGLRDSKTHADFWLPAAERPQLEAVLPCRLQDCGGSWRCFSEGGHHAQSITLLPNGEWDRIAIETELYDNNLPKGEGGCRLR